MTPLQVICQRLFLKMRRISRRGNMFLPHAVSRIDRAMLLLYNVAGTPGAIGAYAAQLCCCTYAEPDGGSFPEICILRL